MPDMKLSGKTNNVLWVLLVAIISTVIMAQRKHNQRVNRGTVFSNTQPIQIPDKKDTLRSYLLCSDTTIFKGDFVNPTAYHRIGYTVIGGDQWSPIFLDINKKELPSVVVVWQFVILKKF